MSWVLGAVWGAFGLATAWRLRPVSRRDLPRPSRPRRFVPPRHAVRIGCGLVVIAAGAIDVWLGIAAVVAFALRHRVASRVRGDDRERSVVAELPDVVDLLALTTSAGLTPRQSVTVVAGHGDGPVFEALARVDAQVAAGGRFGPALDLLTARLGPAVHPLTRVIAETVHYGTPLGPALERLGSDLRGQRRRAAETAARRVPVRLLFPLVACILPAFALLTVVPLLAGSLHALRG